MSRDIMGDVRQGAAEALEKTEATSQAAKEGILDAIARVSEIFQAVRGFGMDDALSTVGLQRKRSPMLALSMLGVGIACGAALGVMLAPQSGKKLRGMLKTQFNELFEKSEEKVAGVVDSTVAKAKDTVEEVKEKAKDVPVLRRALDPQEFAATGTNGRTPR